MVSPDQIAENKNESSYEPLAKVIKSGYFLRFIRLLFFYNFLQSKTNRRKANEPRRDNIMAEDENASRFISPESTT
jgi:hypothetical protein